MLLAWVSGKDGSLVDKEDILRGGNSTGKYMNESRIDLRNWRPLSIAGINITREGDEAGNVSRTQIIKGLIYYY